MDSSLIIFSFILFLIILCVRVAEREMCSEMCLVMTDIGGDNYLMTDRFRND